ncbi:hypothetical protein [Vibrio sagamiensis]|uniref:DNA polymerase III subunit beta n=1 Tax=Vibrio sagamiensis NBRC 104589 TaxID=1219064 RepID=A0A511QAA9_9VIBR|nr:hypothetical protein [Vibrio sagamiensis]PNQ70230.1 hypothetical protein C1141_05255 [Vibrio agarivorans]GEM74196.1 hypothetical protein VSA01S_03080 [Vibrio sagamiensis NBRC 104589]
MQLTILFLKVFLILLLTGCHFSPALNWHQGNQITLNKTRIELDSHLWVNLVPIMEKQKNNYLYGSLYFSADKPLPADVMVEAVIIKQGREEWKIQQDTIELRIHDQHYWEVVFAQKVDADMNRRFEVALLLQKLGKTAWLVERGVKVEKVYY